ncbi:MAG: IS66 family transposase [Bacteroidales bacterium]|nr:IS66 family transposase [Bacteroidales bacterium]
MAEGPVSDKQLIEALLRERDELYRRATKAEHRLEELSDADAMRREYEARIRQMQASHQKELSKKEDEYKKVLSKKEDEIRSLVARIEYMARKLWGRMSEKRRTPDDPHQLKLDFEGMDLTDDEKRQLEEAARKVTEARKVKVKEHEKQLPVRRKLPENLRRVEEHVYPEGYIGHEDEWILFNDTETSEHLEVTAPDAYVRVTVRHKAMRKSDSRIITAPAKAEPLAKSYAGPTLLTELTIGKFADHLPFYRQIQMYKRLGVELKQPTIEGWFHGIADLMRPMYYSLQEHMLRLDYLQSDESTVPVIDNEKRRAVKGYMWLIRAVTEPLVLFHYHEGSRGKEVALRFFKDYQGALGVDGYGVYDLLDKLDGIMVLCCWAHCRRYFERSLNHDRERAEYAIEQIGMLYSVETIADEECADQERRAQLRQELSYPIIRGLEAWALNERDSVLPKSPIGKALGYLLRHIRQLSRYTTDGSYQIDNNFIENSVRPLALGRKNYLFCGNHDAAEDAAVIYTFMGCCKLAQVDVRKWLNHFFTHIHDYDQDYSRDLLDLLPHNLKNKGIL